MTEFIHEPVMLEECLDGLAVRPGGIYADGTLGGGGHSEGILVRLDSTGFLVGIDRDGDAIAAVEKRFDKNRPGKNYKLVREKHENIKQVLDGLGIAAADGFLLDLGVSSHQLDTPERGFSYRFDAPLDMRMDVRDSLSAYDIVNGYAERDLAVLIKTYGEERFAKRIARLICRQRADAPVRTSLQLAQLIESAVPRTKKSPSHGHPAMRTFQALRIAVNGELTGLAQTITDMAGLLTPGGRICIITFHSLEDRIVKQTFKHLADPCECPRDIPYCVCGKKPQLSIITKKPVRPSACELELNPRSHSAKLRISEGVIT